MAMAEAGKLAKTLDVEIMETIDVVEEYECITETLEVFVEFETEGVFECAEEKIAETITASESLMACTEKFHQSMSMEFDVEGKFSSKKR